MIKLLISNLTECYLQAANYGLKHFDVSWNCIRFKGAVGMAQALKVIDRLLIINPSSCCILFLKKNSNFQMELISQGGLNNYSIRVY